MFDKRSSSARAERWSHFHNRSLASEGSTPIMARHDDKPKRASSASLVFDIVK
jgi:hypothetical protein